jgi:hypothetical protein
VQLLSLQASVHHKRTLATGVGINYE